jgi:hypothetical protein
MIDVPAVIIPYGRSLLRYITSPPSTPLRPAPATIVCQDCPGIPFLAY